MRSRVAPSGLGGELSRGFGFCKILGKILVVCRRLKWGWLIWGTVLSESRRVGFEDGSWEALYPGDGVSKRGLEAC